MSESDELPEHVDIRGDPPVIDDLDMLLGITSFRIGNRTYVHAVEQIDAETYVAYLGVSMVTDTSAGAGRGEITFCNYAPVGAMYAHEVERDGETYYEVDLPDRDDISAAVRARERYENEHRAAVIPPVVNDLEDWEAEHDEKAADADELLEKAVYGGMALGFEVARREVERRRDAPYKGDRRWSREELDEVVDFE